MPHPDGTHTKDEHREEILRRAQAYLLAGAPAERALKQAGIDWRHHLAREADEKIAGVMKFLGVSAEDRRPQNEKDPPSRSPAGRGGRSERGRAACEETNSHGDGRHNQDRTRCGSAALAPPGIDHSSQPRVKALNKPTPRAPRLVTTNHT